MFCAPGVDTPLSKAKCRDTSSRLRSASRPLSTVVDDAADVQLSDGRSANFDGTSQPHAQILDCCAASKTTHLSEAPWRESMSNRTETSFTAIFEQSTAISEGVPSRNQSDSSQTVSHRTCSSSGSSSHDTRRLQVQSQAPTSEGTTGGSGDEDACAQDTTDSVRRSDSRSSLATAHGQSQGQGMEGQVQQHTSDRANAEGACGSAFAAVGTERWKVMHLLRELSRQNPGRNTSDRELLQFMHDLLEIHLKIPSPRVVPTTRLSASRLPGTSLTGPGLQSTMLSALLHATPETERSGSRVRDLRGRRANRFAGQHTTPEGETGNEGVVASRFHSTSIPTGHLQEDHDIPVDNAMRCEAQTGLGMKARRTRASTAHQHNHDMCWRTLLSGHQVPDAQ
eukprot:CAMPEP_0194523462 /NCGR_PEP_ID=MMETSP0253-20130528/58357_1 /TAXON_ID=2966 /ORGANISM="Noctiluca scintillans" /LENGTH=395 /DNA_ID=CAMNT_0039368005 /DNA_START=56 /DNA_END=1244 /DNA_ORIENTATION=+